MKSIRTIAVILILVLIAASTACELDPVDPGTDFSGAWNCSAQSTLSGSQTYQVQIVNDSLLGGRVYIGNFNNLGASYKVMADFLGFTVDIPAQTVAGKGISGLGDILNANKITMNYVVTDGIDADTVNATLTRVQ